MKRAGQGLDEPRQSQELDPELGGTPEGTQPTLFIAQGRGPEPGPRGPWTEPTLAALTPFPGA